MTNLNSLIYVLYGKLYSMGGNALNIKTIRLGKEQYLLLEKEVINKLGKIFNNKVSSIPYYNDKESFGDMDLLVEKPKPSDLKKLLSDLFNSKDYYFNSDIVSFEYKDFQIDLIFTDKEIFDSSLFYFSYNDLNNLLGCIYRSHFNLKFGYNGLAYPLRYKDGLVNENIIVSRDRREIYEFIGLDYERYLKGFDTLYEIFDYVISSKYFNHEFFAYSNLDAANRTRNKKRKTYQEFLSYLKEKGYDLNHSITKLKTTDRYLEYIDGYFKGSDIINNINHIKFEFEENQKIKEKFSGAIIMDLIPEIKGKELGAFIKYFKKNFETEEVFSKFVKEQNSHYIKDLILEMYGFFKEK